MDFGYRQPLTSGEKEWQVNTFSAARKALATDNAETAPDRTGCQGHGIL